MDDRTIEKTINGGRYRVGNQWVVPYNLYLATKYNAHINVETCANTKAVKYLYKHVHKGSHCAEVVISSNTASTHTQAEIQNEDEIQQFLNGRHISGAESCWRLFEKKMQSHFLSVIRLDIHLPDGSCKSINMGNTIFFI